MDPKKLLLVTLLLVLGSVMGQSPPAKCQAMGEELSKCQAKSTTSICHEQQHKFVQTCAQTKCAKVEEIFYLKLCYTKYDPECEDIIDKIVAACEEFDVDVVNMDSPKA